MRSGVHNGVHMHTTWSISLGKSRAIERFESVAERAQKGFSKNTLIGRGESIISLFGTRLDARKRARLEIGQENSKVL
jgi:hypothetical protein